MSWLDQVFIGNTVFTWLIAIGVAIVTYVVLKVAQKVIARRLAQFAEKTKTDVDDLVVDIIKRTRFLFLLIVSLYAASHVLALPESTLKLFDKIIVLGLLLQSAAWGNGVITFLLSRNIKKRMEQDAASATTLSALGFVGKLILWTVILLLALDNLGINITALVAGLGVGGIAVALALQNILGDLFASLSIVLDKPFVLGDFIIVDQHLGTVEHIGLKTTRLRSLSGEQLVFSNSDLLKSRIRNYKRMFERRVVFTLGVTYQTPHEKLEKIGGMIRKIIEAQENTRFDRSHFKEYADSSLVFETVYFVKSPDYNVYMDIQQAINLEIYRQFSEEGIEFAYPTQTLYVHREAVSVPTGKDVDGGR